MEKYIDTVKLNPVVRNRLKVFGKEMSKFKEWSTESIEDRLDIKPYDECHSSLRCSTNETVFRRISFLLERILPIRSLIKLISFMLTDGYVYIVGYIVVYT